MCFGLICLEYHSFPEEVSLLIINCYMILLAWSIWINERRLIASIFSQRTTLISHKQTRCSLNVKYYITSLPRWFLSFCLCQRLDRSIIFVGVARARSLSINMHGYLKLAKCVCVKNRTHLNMAYNIIPNYNLPQTWFWKKTLRCHEMFAEYMLTTPGVA